VHMRIITAYNVKRSLVSYHCAEHSCPNRGWNWLCEGQLLPETGRCAQ
jgi:hypothetical protein